MTCKAFWQEANRLELTDVEALSLIGCSDKISTSGRRRRFQLTQRQAWLAAYLPVVRAALRSSGQVPAWLLRPNRLEPFSGCAPIKLMIERPGEGAVEVVYLAEDQDSIHRRIWAVST